MKANIIIYKENILRELSRRSTYAGVKTESESPKCLFDRVATVEEDDELLASYWRDACAEIIDALKDFLVAAGFGDETLTLELTLSEAFDPSLLPALEQEIASWLSASLSYRWFRLTLPASAPEWESEGRRLHDAVICKIYHRKAPVRR